MNPDKRYFFCGVGGSGMLPLALIVQARGADVEGSDRALDQGRTAAKFDFLRGHGVGLHPQDGSGVTRADQIAGRLRRRSRTPCPTSRPRGGSAPRRSPAPELLAELFNAAPVSDRRRRHQRQVDHHRHDRLDPARRRPRPDGDERRGDEELRHRRRALRQRPGRRRRRCSSARSTRATARSPATGRPSRWSTTSRSTTSRWTSCAPCSRDFAAKARTAVLNLDNAETAAAGGRGGRPSALTYSLRDAAADLLRPTASPPSRAASPSRSPSRRPARRAPVRLPVPGRAQRLQRPGRHRRGPRLRRAAGRGRRGARRLHRHPPAAGGGRRRRAGSPSSTTSPTTPTRSPPPSTPCTPFPAGCW